MEEVYVKGKADRESGCSQCRMLNQFFLLLFRFTMKLMTINEKKWAMAFYLFLVLCTIRFRVRGWSLRFAVEETDFCLLFLFARTRGCVVDF